MTNNKTLLSSLVFITRGLTEPHREPQCFQHYSAEVNTLRLHSYIRHIHIQDLDTPQSFTRVIERIEERLEVARKRVTEAIEQPNSPHIQLLRRDVRGLLLILGIFRREQNIIADGKNYSTLHHVRRYQSVNRGRNIECIEIRIAAIDNPSLDACGSTLS